MEIHKLIAPIRLANKIGFRPTESPSRLQGPVVVALRTLMTVVIAARVDQFNPNIYEDKHTGLYRRRTGLSCW